MSNIHRETIGQRWIKRIYSDKNQDLIKVTSTEEKMKIDNLQDSGYSTNKTTDKITENLISNKKSDVFEYCKDETTDKIHDNDIEKEEEIPCGRRKRKLNIIKAKETVTKSSLLKELFYQIKMMIKESL